MTNELTNEQKIEAAQSLDIGTLTSIAQRNAQRHNCIVWIYEHAETKQIRSTTSLVDMNPNNFCIASVSSFSTSDHYATFADMQTQYKMNDFSTWEESRKW